MRSVLIGMLVGIGAGFLAAPTTGRALRRLLRARLAKLTRQTSLFISDRRDHFQRAKMGYEAGPHYLDAIDDAAMDAVAGF